MSAPQTTPTGIRIIDCEQCERRHPEMRKHCSTCGSPSMFPHSVRGGVS